VKINKLHLYNYRNHSNLLLEFKSNYNIFYGRNAEGKTNIVESIYSLNFSKSHRTNKDGDLIKMGEEFARIGSIIENDGRRKKLQLMISPKGKKAFINNENVDKLTDFINNLNLVFFAPEHLQIIKGSPANRRKYLDMFIAQLSKPYLSYLSDYNVVLKQRNEYLKMMMVNGNQDKTYFDILTDKLVELALKIYKIRLKYVDMLAHGSSLYFSSIFLSKKLTMKYDFSFDVVGNDLRASLEKVYKDNFRRELQLGSTRYGPHRDDFSFFIDGQNAKDFGSQGQQRLIILNLKLAEIDLFKKETGFYPILVLDDVLSEIDKENQIKFLKSINKSIQTFITTTDRQFLNNSFFEDADCFLVKDGIVKLIARGEDSVD
jgi:DNA replication and repair protein RecF